MKFSTSPFLHQTTLLLYFGYGFGEDFRKPITIVSMNRTHSTTPVPVANNVHSSHSTITPLFSFPQLLAAPTTQFSKHLSAYSAAASTSTPPPVLSGTKTRRPKTKFSGRDLEESWLPGMSLILIRMVRSYGEKRRRMEGDIEEALRRMVTLCRVLLRNY